MRQEQLRGKLGAPHTSSRVDARRKHKTDGGRGQAAVFHPSLAQQHFQADITGLGQLFQPRRNDDAVLTRNRHHVRHRAQCDQIGIPIKYDLRVAFQRTNQLECHAHARKAVKRIGTIRPLAIDHRIRGGQRVVTFMVVGDDHLHAQRTRSRDLLIRRDAGINRDEQARALVV